MKSMRMASSINPAPIHPNRRGTILVLGMLALFLISMLLTQSVRLALLRHSQLQQQQRELQAAWLAEAGVQRAQAALRADPNYSGEVWPLTAQDLGGPLGGEVRITVLPGEANESARLQVTADYPLEIPARCRVTRTVSLGPARAADGEAPATPPADETP